MTDLDPHDADPDAAADDTGYAVLAAAKAAAEQRQDPYPLLARLLAEGEFCFSPDNHAFVYGYEQASATLRSREFYKGGEHVSSVSPHFTAEQRAIIERERPETPGMLSSIDDPDHARLRRLVTAEFRPRAVAELRATTTRVLAEVLDKIDPTEPADLLATLATEIPSQVVGALIGLPLADRGMFAELAAIASIGRDPDVSFEDQLRATRARRRMHEYIADMVAEERRTPRDTLVGRLLRLELAGESITEPELVSLVQLMHSAGFGTTKRLMGNGIVALLQHPDQAAMLRADPELARRAAQEVLRFDTSVMSVSYWIADGAEVAGIPLEAGKLCTVLIGAANRDHRVFDDPSRFDIMAERSAPPMSFGFGAHFCLGNALAGMETEILLSELVQRYPRMVLAAEPIREPHFRARTFDAVSVLLEPSAA